MRILTHSTRSLKGMGNITLHFAHLTGIDATIDLLTRNRTDSDSKLLKNNYNLSMNNVVNIFSQKYYEKYLKKYKNWFDIYENLDVSCLKVYDLFYIAGGLYLPNAGIDMNGKQLDLFPLKAGVSFQSHGSSFINILAMLKAHHKFGIPVHELTFDPDELHMNHFHPNIKTNVGKKYFLYHSYDNPRQDIIRLDSNIFYALNYPFTGCKKDFDLTFGYTYKKNIRSTFINEFEEFAENISNKNIFKKEIGGDKEHTFLSREKYLEYIARSRFTYIMPAYWNDFFSGYRLIESLHLDCLPILNEHCKTDDINTSFGINLDILKVKEIPTEKFRLEQLEILKNKIFNCKMQLLRGVEYKSFLNNTNNDW